jgi:hypothetical protein
VNNETGQVGIKVHEGSLFTRWNHNEDKTKVAEE